MIDTQLRTYKIAFIFDSRGADQPVDVLVAHLQEVISALGGKVTEVVNLGQRDFVRVTSRKFTGAPYVRLTVQGEPSLPAALKEKLRLDRRYYRILVEKEPE